MHLPNLKRMSALRPSHFGVVVAALLLAIGERLICVAAPADNPECTIAYLDKCGQYIFLWTTSLNEVMAPANTEQLKEHCERQAASEDCVRKRSEKCHSSVKKGLSRLFYDAIHEEYEQRCDPESDYHASYLRMAPCIHKISSDMYNCSARLIASIRSSMEDDHGKSVRERIPRACCNFVSYTRCAEVAARKTCDEDTVNFVKQYLERISGELFSLACGSYSVEAEVCKKFQTGLLTSHEDVKLTDESSVTTMIGALSTLANSFQPARR
ncbi:uncharacterized protein LOC111246656 [Varroa destructor]|uniref:Secreted protein n=1 Tax=Varroa destructor TaxID=109461 RepID=A0A7M7JID7_VARDE|nr:uncharacterized protein LOC111246656 [Varroa destructor]XP_022652336.1 uncharacterized protein LOC111246656 [Varroa destructor]XP_022652337.1 uncharacterized protein LOC111246656 [Varroa destructor]